MGPLRTHTLAELARAFGHCNKVYDDNNVTVSRQFSEQVTVAVFAPRAKVCRRVVMGTRILPARIVPATDEVHIPASRVEIVEWRCDPLLDDDFLHPFFGRLKKFSLFPLACLGPKLSYT